ncbi:MAG: recombinase family protein [Candidatus Azobacteroides sp.]|nr:recombinase family protein [Candidatus Azobacteroides sp.]
MIYGYIRVSTDSQDAENQKIGINSLAKNKGIMVEKWISDDGVSGTVDYHNRKLGILMKRLKRGDIVLVSEISRLARNMYMLFEILKYLAESQIEMYTVKDGYTLDGTITSKVLAFGLGLAAEIERDMISKRTKEGLEARRRAGVVLGRPIGSKSKTKKLDEKAEQIAEYLKKGLGYSAIARLTKSHRLTVSDYCKNNDLEKYKINNPVTRNRKENQLITIMSNPKHSAYQIQQLKIENDTILEIYIKCGFSLDGLRKDIGIGSQQTLRSFLKKRGIWDKIVELNAEQRNKIKSLCQIERESGVSRRKK